MAKNPNGGRPKVRVRDRRDRVISFRVTNDQGRALDAQAKEAGTTVNGIARHRTLAGVA